LWPREIFFNNPEKIFPGRKKNEKKNVSQPIRAYIVFFSGQLEHLDFFSDFSTPPGGGVKFSPGGQ